MMVEANSQHMLIRQAVAQSLDSRNRYVEQVVNDLTDELAVARGQVGAAILSYKSLGSLPANKLAGLKGLERLDTEIKSIMTGLKRSHTIRCRTEAKAAFRLGVYQGIEEFTNAQLPVYRDLTPDGLDKLTTKAFQIIDTDALDFLANYTTTLAGDVNRETTDGIMRTIRGAIATGKGVDDIVRDLGEVVKDKESFRYAGTKVFSKAQYRMEVIARTEVLRAHNMGKLKFHQAVGIQRLEWFTMDDERVCPVCGPRDGQQYPIDNFPPQPAHPQCRCGHNPAWPLVICGQGVLASSAAVSPGDACILPPQSIEGLAAAQAEEQKALKTAFEGGDTAKLGALTMKQLQTLAKGQGVAIARTKADFHHLLDLAEAGIDHSALGGKALEAKLKQYAIGALRSKDELVELLAAKQAAFIQQQIQAQMLKDAAKSASGLESMTVKELQELAGQKGVSLNMTKADVISLLDQLEPDVDHSGLAGQALIAAKKQFHIGPLKNKGQLIAAIEKVAGQEMGDAAKQAVIDAAQQSALKAAQQALDNATVKVMVPTSPQGFPDFLTALQSAEQVLASSSGLPKTALEKAAQELALKKAVFQQQVSALTANDLKMIAKQAKIPHWQWATKNDFVTLMSETNQASVQAAKDAIEAKWQQWKLQQAAGGSSAKKAADKAAQEAAEQAAEIAKQHAVETMKAAVDAMPGMVAPEHYEDFLQAFSQATSTFISQAAHLSPEQIATVQAKLAQQKAHFQGQLAALKLTDLKAIAKGKKIKNWAFATKDDLITLMSETDLVKLNEVSNALSAKVAGYGHGAQQTAKVKAASPVAHPPPSPQISGPDFSTVDAHWSTIVENPSRHFTFVKDARDLGGVHPKQIYRDPEGNEWLFKPMPQEFLTHGDEMTYHVTRLFDPEAVEVRAVNINGQRGTIQRMKTGVLAQSNYEQVAVSSIVPEELAQLQQQQVIDWLLSNHDAHAENFLRLSNGRVIGIDRAQAFKYFGSDRLDIGYNPNATGQHPRTLYNDLMQAAKTGKLKLDPSHTLAAIERVESLPDAEYLAILRAYSERRFAGDARGLQGFYDTALERKHALRQDFETLYREILHDPDFSFDLLSRKDFTRLPMEIVEEITSDVPKLGCQGKAIPFDTDMVEDQNLLIYIEQVQGASGVNSTRTVMRMKVRPDAERPLLKAIQKALKDGGEVVVGSPLPEDTFYDAILQGVKTVNHHLGDGQYNTTKLQGAYAVRKDLEKLLTSKQTDVQVMARQYLDILQQLEVSVANRSAERLPAFSQFVATAPRQSKKTTAYTVTKTKVHMPNKKLERGELVVQNDNASLRDLLGGSKNGEQYDIDFGDGMHAVYRPWNGENHFAQRGEFELRFADKPTAKSIDHAMEVMEQLGIPAHVASPEEMELLYLHKQAYLSLEHKESAYCQLLADLDARGADTSNRVGTLRAYWGSKLGVADVTKLPGYDPSGVYQLGFLDRNKLAGYRQQLRFDLSDDDIRRQLDGFALKHHVTNSNDIASLVDTMLSNNGAMVSTVEKMRVGVQVGGMSPVEDMNTGGASYCFTRIAKHPRRDTSASEGFYFKMQMIRRMDAISYDHDAYGKVIGGYVEEHRQSTVSAWKNICSRSGNETIFKNSVTLLDNIDVIVVKNTQRKQALLEVFRKHGISTLPDGRTVEQIIVVH